MSLALMEHSAMNSHAIDEDARNDSMDEEVSSLDEVARLAAERVRPFLDGAGGTAEQNEGIERGMRLLLLEKIQAARRAFLESGLREETADLFISEMKKLSHR